MTQSHSAILQAKSLYDDGFYVEAAKGLQLYIYNNYSGWTERRNYPTKAELQNMGFESLDSYKEFEKDLYVRSLNTSIKDAEAAYQNGDYKTCLDTISEALLLAHLGNMLHIDRADTETLTDILKDTQIENAEDVFNILKSARDEVILPTLQEFWNFTEAGDFESAYNSLGKIREPVRKAQPIKHDIVKSNTTPPSAFALFTERKGLALEDVLKATEDTKLYHELKTILQEHGPSYGKDLAGEKIDKIQTTLDSRGIDTIDSIPEKVQHALEKKLNISLSLETSRLHFGRDLNSFIFGTAHRNNQKPSESAISDASLVSRFVEAKGRSSVFALTVEDFLPETSKTGFIYPAWERARSQTLAFYRDQLETLDRPDYRASEVREDYYKAAASGANLPMQSIKDRIHYIGYRLGLA